MSTPTFEKLARETLAEPVMPHWQYGSATRQDIWKSAAQAYLDNLSEGFDEPEELIELLAKDEAAEAMPESFPSCDADGYSWSAGPYSEDAWWAEELPYYIAKVRSSYGMVVSA
ncbi:hypothetical protein UFOVP368_46 [uncultured Caudovirales phage]|uniref:Uncharacterized protein n=1 Tax=uncultured Caudovirales phage TaxID=2100421 RepID=A0A6J7X1I2_9CAUD|nr:hypothetical protein UFOVP368_46 [uncultured Caudovirales phage]